VSKDPLLLSDPFWNIERLVALCVALVAVVAGYGMTGALRLARVDGASTRMGRPGASLADTLDHWMNQVQSVVEGIEHAMLLRAIVRELRGRSVGDSKPAYARG